VITADGFDGGVERSVMRGGSANRCIVVAVRRKQAGGTV
jgi:hypothetical protein